VCFKKEAKEFFIFGLTMPHLTKFYWFQVVIPISSTWDMAGDAAHLAGKAWMQANGRVATLCNFSDSPLEASTQRMLSNIMQLKAHICSRQACSIPWRNPFAGFDISSRHIEGANADGILIVHGQKVAANKHCLNTSTPCLDEGFKHACFQSS